MEKQTDFETFFEQAPQLNPSRSLIKGVVCGVRVEDIEEPTMREICYSEILIAGQFGAHLTADSLIGSGILPEGAGNKISYIGNTSKAGAHIALVSLDARREMEKLASCIDYIELSAMEDYGKLFIKCLEFPKK